MNMCKNLLCHQNTYGNVSHAKNRTNKAAHIGVFRPRSILCHEIINQPGVLP